MTIKLAITGRPSIVVDGDEVSLGSAPHCTISFLDYRDIKPKHAVIRMVAGRWLIETRDGDAIYLADGVPKRLQWLKPGDLVRLSPDGPAVTFQPDDQETPTETVGIPLSTVSTTSKKESSEWSTSTSSEVPHPQMSLRLAKDDEPLQISAVELFKTATMANDSHIKATTSAEAPAQESGEEGLLQRRDPPPLPGIFHSPEESPEPAPLQRLDFGWTSDESGAEDLSPSSRREIDPEIQWIIKIIVRIGAVGIVILLILLAFSEMKQ